MTMRARLRQHPVSAHPSPPAAYTRSRERPRQTHLPLALQVVRPAIPSIVQSELSVHWTQLPLPSHSIFGAVPHTVRAGLDMVPQHSLSQIAILQTGAGPQLVAVLHAATPAGHVFSASTPVS